MAVVLIAWELGGGLGHLYPLSQLARRLRGQGHRVILASRDLARVEGLFGGCGIEYLQAPFSHGPPPGEIRRVRTYAHILQHFGFGKRDELLALTSAWTGLFELIKPDLLLADHSPSAVLAARRVSLKCAAIGTGFFFPPDESPLPDMWPQRTPDPDRCRQDEQAVLDNVNRLLSDWGRPLLPRLSRLVYDVEAILLTTLPELDPYSRQGNANYYGVLPLLGGCTPVWPDADGTRIFAYLKPFPGLPTLLAGLGQLGQGTLVYLSPADEQIANHYSKGNLKIVTEPVDMELVRRQADCAILHGGHGSTLAMLLAGKPILQLPLQTEQAINSLAVEKLGAGTWANPIERANELPQIVRGFLENLAAYSQASQQFAYRYSQMEPMMQLDRLAARVTELASTA